LKFLCFFAVFNPFKKVSDEQFAGCFDKRILYNKDTAHTLLYKQNIFYTFLYIFLTKKSILIIMLVRRSIMKIDWITKNSSLGAVTLYENNITLNKHAANYFKDAYAVAVGIDRESGNIIIQKVSKEEAENHDAESLHKIAIKPSYGRISGKHLITEISDHLALDFRSKTAYKFSALWNTGNRMLIVNTKEVY